MKILKDRILKDGKCYPGGILKVDNFINHQNYHSRGQWHCSCHHGRLSIGTTRSFRQKEKAQYHGKYVGDLCLFFHQTTLV